MQGYAFRHRNSTVEIKDEGGSWSPLQCTRRRRFLKVRFITPQHIVQGLICIISGKVLVLQCGYSDLLLSVKTKLIYILVVQNPPKD